MPIRGLKAKRVVLIGALAVAVAGLFLAVTIVAGPWGTKEPVSPSAAAARERRPASTGIGDARAVQASYERWKVQQVRSEGDRMLALPLGYSKGLSARFTKAQGHVRLDLADGTISVEVSGLPPEKAFDVWLVDNRPGPGRSVKPEAGDNLVRAGRLERAGDAFALREQLGRELLNGFELDLVVVAPAGGDLGAEGLLFGAPNLFHRLYYREQRTTVAAADGGATGTVWTPFSALVPRPAWAQAAGADALLIQMLVENGRQLFFEETFEGNGRTCGTCHDGQNNLTIDPEFIAGLPQTDSLFVAETQNALKCENPNPVSPTGCKFENPVLMRKFGLILENVDGFKNPDGSDRPGVMRGVPHTLALGLSLTPSATDGTTTPPNERTGWSGDGAPPPGALRQFAVGAVIQHFPKTLNRVEGVDFRLPTEPELDALEAFQRSLGRGAELNLSTMVFQSPTVEQGKQLFITSGCNACHSNAGANATFGGGNNRNFDTGVENFSHPADALDPPQPRPRDGGFGTGPNPDGGFGNGTFNTPVVVEAAAKRTFFHNNVVKTIEEAVAFYTSDAFDASPSGPRLELTPGQVNLVAAFLRVINAREKMRSSTATLRVARDADFEDARSLLEFSISEDDHAIRVLNERGLHRVAVRHLIAARGLATTARRVPFPTVRSLLIGLAIVEQKAACANLVQGAACDDLNPQPTP